jgi:glycosyltransferase involved in cell wall biosynthesis
MRLLHITAGAGGMYCGSCVRDNALAAELLARGHDTALLPIYTPTLTDEANVSSEEVLFGGISVYLQQHVPLLRKTPALFDKIWDSAAVIKALAGRSVAVDPRLLGELTISTLKGEQGFQAKEVKKLLRWFAEQPPFDAVVLPNALLISLAGPIKRQTGARIFCTLQGEDLFLEGLEARYREECMALIRAQVKDVDTFVAVSGYYADFMAGYFAIPKSKLAVVPLGINLEGHRPDAAPADRPFTIGYFARVAPEKSLDILADAYRVLRQEKGLPPSRLEAAGYMAPEQRPYLAQIEGRLREWGLAGEFRYHGTLGRAEKIAFLKSIDVLSVPSRYVEPKGLYLLEAWANGVPVVQPRHGSFPEMIGRTGGGLLFEPGNPDDLADKILSLWKDPARAHELGAQGAVGVREHYSVARMADRALEVYSGAPRAVAAAS